MLTLHTVIFIINFWDSVSEFIIFWSPVINLCQNAAELNTNIEEIGIYYGQSEYLKIYKIILIHKYLEAEKLN